MANYVTLLRFLLAFLAVYAILNQYNTLALLIILIGAVSDWLDGDIARKRKFA